MAVSYCISGLLLARKYPIVLLNVGASSYAAMLRIAKTGNDLGFRSADSDERGDHLNLPGKPKTMEREREGILRKRVGLLCNIRLRRLNSMERLFALNEKWLGKLSSAKARRRDEVARPS